MVLGCDQLVCPGAALATGVVSDIEALCRTCDRQLTKTVSSPLAGDVQVDVWALVVDHGA